MGRKNKIKKKEVSQAEIWDDSALLQSWDDALAEYKMYHSIHARGERVEDVTTAYEKTGQDLSQPEVLTKLQAPANGVIAEELEDGELEEGGAEELSEPATNEVAQEFSHQQSSPTNLPSQHKAVPNVPTAMANGVKDEALKNIMMSWYYAGYYTGLYEGQQSSANTAAK